MNRPRLLLSVAAVAAAPLLAFAPAAFAQDGYGQPPPPPPPGMGPAPGEQVTSTPTYPSANPSNGIPPRDATNPFPGSPGPYAGAGPQHFYDPGQRIQAIGSRLDNLPPGRRAAAARQLHAISADLAYRRQRHGGMLRDWDRELINGKLDHLVQQYPALRG